MIFLTVGTVLPFDRLVKAVDDAVGADSTLPPVFAQVGKGGYKPLNMDFAEVLDRDAFETRVNQADTLIGHAGIGTIVTALERHKPLLVMPRRAALGEHVNDHQLDTALSFASHGHILATDDESDLPEMLRKLASFEPVPRKANPDRIISAVKSLINRAAGKSAPARSSSGGSLDA